MAFPTAVNNQITDSVTQTQTPEEQSEQIETAEKMIEQAQAEQQKALETAQESVQKAMEAAQKNIEEAENQAKQ